MVEVVFCENTKKNLERAKRSLAKKQGDVLRESTGQVVVIRLHMEQGNISDNGQGNERLEFLKQKKNDHLYGDEFDFGKMYFDESMQAIENIKSALQNNEIIRIWYGENSEEFCGFCWLLFLIDSWKLCNKIILYVKLPKYAFSFDREYTKYYGSGSFDIDELAKYSLSMERISDSFVQVHTDIWNNALDENSQLRVYMNGILLSTDEDFFDSVILREASKLDNVFYGRSLVGNLISRIELDEAFFCKRIEKLIKSGKFSVVKENEDPMLPMGETLKRNYE